jgi:hypothetical protein
MDGWMRFSMGELQFQLKPGWHLGEVNAAKYLSSEPSMPRRFLVQIDLELLRSHLAEADRDVKTPEQIHQFLIESGFKQTPMGWVVSEADLGVLDADEVLAIDDAPEDE